MNYDNFIGKRVHKSSGKPFKSGNKINTVKGVVIHPFKHKVKKDIYAFTFVEDDSVVECEKCLEC